MAPDQRYCLECGERRLPMSSVLEGPRPGSEQARPTPPATPSTPPRPPELAPPEAAAPANSTLTVIAGVGVLLLAMGVGVLIGRSTASKPGMAAPQVITVAGGSAPSSSTGTEASFTSDWPSGTKGYTVRLQTLPQSGTAVSAVEAAKSAATAKGAKSVGALKSEEFSSLSGSDYVIYSGVYHKRSEAQKALAALKRSFPGASVIEVSNGSSTSSEGSAGSSSGAGSSLRNPAPPSVLNNLKSAKGKSYAEKSKNLPNVISTG